MSELTRLKTILQELRDLDKQLFSKKLDRRSQRQIEKTWFEKTEEFENICLLESRELHELKAEYNEYRLSRHERLTGESLRRTPRTIIIDGNNIARSHGGGKTYSCKGIKIAVEYFVNRGHPKVYAVIPWYRQFTPRSNAVTDHHILKHLKEQGNLLISPQITYDDTYILRLADETNGVVLSKDKFRDFLDKDMFIDVIRKRRLDFMFGDDKLFPREDPLGKHGGPDLDKFLSMPVTSKPAFATQPAAQTATQPATQPVTQPATQLATQTATQPATQTATQPGSQSVRQSQQVPRKRKNQNKQQQYARQQQRSGHQQQSLQQ